METPYFSILVICTSKGFFKSSRGLRQDNSLSLFLFSLVEGFITGDDNLMVSHL